MKKSLFVLSVLAFCTMGASSAMATPPLYAPWTCGKTYQITQGNNEYFSHYDMGYGYSDTYAWDVGMGIGEEVRAPADGYVSMIQSGSTTGGCNASYGTYANYVTLCFNDGSGKAALFYHLNDVAVSYNQQVKRGQLIGHSGQTGFSCGAHLHYAITWCNKYYDSTPASWANYGVPTTGQWITSDNCDVVDDSGSETTSSSGNEDILTMAMMYDPQTTDINGDGKADICARGYSGLYCALGTANGFGPTSLVLNVLNDGYGWNDISAATTIRFADVNGDGKSDVCAKTDNGINCWLSNGSSFGNMTPALTALGDGYYDTAYTTTFRYADINGDGKDDFCARMKDKFRCFLSNGNGFDTEVAIDDLGDSTGWNHPQYGSTLRMADVDGDGKMDVCGRGLDTVYCWFSNGSSWSSEVSMQSGDSAWSDAKGWNEEKYYATIRFADINGDGKADICARDSKSIICQLSNGRSGFGKTVRGPAWDGDFSTYDFNNYTPIMFGDLNGDGKDDVCQRTDSNLACALSNGDGFDKEYKIDFFGDSNGQDTKSTYRTHRLGDLNGDGKMEVCARSDKGVKCFKFTGSGFSEVTEGMPDWSDAQGWDGISYYSTIRFGGPKFDCSKRKEICDGIDNNCDGRVDEGDVCTPTCEPTREICDGKDNDCDGKVDEDDVCTPTCVPETEICDGKDNDCDGQIDEDDVCKADCKSETEICDGKDNDCDGQIDEDDVCTPTCVPTMEICDGKDNDCDGQIDEDNACTPTCVAETETCDGKDNDCDGQIDEDNVCTPTCVPETEICDGKDNNCDGQIDEGLEDCKANCIPTTETCDGKDNDCDGEIDEDGACTGTCIPTTEICDGKDNDCDGEIDEDGACAGTCVPGTEICDGKDNDCDGEIDEGDVCIVSCVAAKEICDGKIDEGDVCSGVCVPAKEICDGKDNDCDGKIDEGDVCSPSVTLLASGSGCSQSGKHSPFTLWMLGFLAPLCLLRLRRRRG